MLTPSILIRVLRRPLAFYDQPAVRGREVGCQAGQGVAGRWGLPSKGHHCQPPFPLDDGEVS
ncbi:hypothetical protein GCM10022419_094470 [Nonomuraea rosea]|uniref:Uncharacterized protein n=1 Tax=Nonomuraea rosea TaxID=638574 RepID=A0ABP6Z3V2_9ACTN